MADLVPSDRLWKAAIEDFFDAFLAYFFPDFLNQVDFSKPVEFLDQELAQLMPNHAEKSRRADKLAKVWLKTGQDQWFLIHIEAQGYDDGNFARRMFTSYYRILDKHDRDITAVVIYTNPTQRQQPSLYRREWMETTLEYRFKTLALTEVSQGSLARGDNPFGVVLQAAWAMVQRKPLTEMQLSELRLGLFRKLLAAGMDKMRIARLVYFIANFVHLTSPELNRIFEAEVEDVFPKPKPTMGIIETVHEFYKEKGLEAGLQQGMQQGMQQGIQQGIQQGLQQGRAEESLAKDRAFVTRLIRAGFPDAEIVEYTDTTPEFVQQMRQELDATA